MGAPLFEKKYRIRELIGKGGMGEVYAATHVISKADVAIKLIPRSRATEELRTRLLKESAALGALIHPSIVRLHDAGVTDEGIVYIIMERVHGEPLRKLISSATKKNERIGLLVVLFIMAQVAEAMQFAHTKGVLHRDLKPENIMVGEGSRAVVLDFGVAKHGVEGETGPVGAKTDPANVMGTPSYMAPEQVRGRALDGRMDIYALGVILYEAISNRRPYDEDQTTSVTEIMAHHAFAEPLPLLDLVPDCPPRIWSIVRKCLAKNPDERFATMGELATEMRAAMREILKPELHRVATPVPATPEREDDDDLSSEEVTVERAPVLRLVRPTAPMLASFRPPRPLPFSEPPPAMQETAHAPREIRETEPMPVGFQASAALPFGRTSAALAEAPSPVPGERVESGVHFKQVRGASANGPEPTPRGIPSSPLGFAFDPTWPAAQVQGQAGALPPPRASAPQPATVRRGAGTGQLLAALVGGLALAVSMLVVVMTLRAPREEPSLQGGAGGPVGGPSATAAVQPTATAAPVPSATETAVPTAMPAATVEAAPTATATATVAPVASTAPAKPKPRPKPKPVATGARPLFDFGSLP